MSAYVIVRLNSSDWSWLREYGQATNELIEKHGGRYLAKGGEMAALEGNEPLPNACTVIEFPDLESARAWYDDPAYQPLKKIREGAADAEIILVDGL